MRAQPIDLIRQQSSALVDLSLIVPAKDEETSLRTLLPALRHAYPTCHILVVDDGSLDRTGVVAQEHGAEVIKHPIAMGNGAAIKTGARNSQGDIIVFMDADGQHHPAAISSLLGKLNEGYDMVVGARSFGSQANLHRGLGNAIYNRLASWMVGHKIEDLTSGFRAVRAEKFREFLDLLPNGFSYPTTITMAFFRAGYTVAYVPIEAGKRIGKSHLRLGRDGIRFLLIIFKIGTLYSPLKLFAPISLGFFLTGLVYYVYTFLTVGRFTNMSALLFSTSVIVFLMGLISEQITQLTYLKRKD